MGENLGLNNRGRPQENLLLYVNIFKRLGDGTCRKYLDN